MDIKAMIEELLEKIKLDKNIADLFKKDPAKTVKDLVGVDIPEDQVNSIVEGVKAKVNLDEASGLFDKVKKLF